MHSNVFSAYICTHAYIYTYLHTFIHEDTTILDNCTHNYAYRSLVMDTRVLFLQLVRLQCNTDADIFKIIVAVKYYYQNTWIYTKL